MGKDVFWGGKVIRIPTEAYEDERGALTPIEFGKYNFTTVRAFLVTAGHGSERGGHAHANCRQILMRISGEIEIEARYCGTTERFTLNQANCAVLIEPSVWSRQTYRGEHPAMIVFCDMPYDRDDYICGCQDSA